MDVRPGNEIAPRTDDDDGAHLAIRIGFPDRRVQPFDHTATQRIDRRIVDDDDRDIPIALRANQSIHAFNFRAFSTAL